MRLGASFAVVECVCSDAAVHQTRIEGRRRDIPGWYELTWEGAARGRDAYRPLDQPKVVVDAIDSLDANLDLVRRALFGAL